MSKKIIAIASGDWHLNKFRQFNTPNMSRLDWGMKMVKEIGAVCKLYGNVPHLFTGDLIHNPKEVENEVISRFLNVYGKVFDRENIRFIGISGNHDLSEKNTGDHKSPSYMNGMKSFDTIEVLDHHTKGVVINGNVKVYGIPYMNNDYDLVRMVKKYTKYRNEFPMLKSILILHSDFPGAKTPEGYEVAETEYIPRDLDKFFRDWDLVLCGHIHKKQRLSKKVYMLGSPIQLDAGQEGEECGYWEIYEDLSLKFIELKNYPKFITLKFGEKSKQDINFYIEKRATKEDNLVSNTEFILSNTRIQLAKNYCKVKGIKDKAKKRALIKVLNNTE